MLPDWILKLYFQWCKTVQCCSNWIPKFTLPVVWNNQILQQLNSLVTLLVVWNRKYTLLQCWCQKSHPYTTSLVTNSHELNLLMPNCMTNEQAISLIIRDTYILDLLLVCHAEHMTNKSVQYMSTQFHIIVDSCMKKWQNFVMKTPGISHINVFVVILWGVKNLWTLEKVIHFFG